MRGTQTGLFWQFHITLPLYVTRTMTKQAPGTTVDIIEDVTETQKCDDREKSNPTREWPSDRSNRSKSDLCSYKRDYLS